MNRIQRLFERIAGISQGERDRWALAQEIYYGPRVEFLSLRTPACWRRSAHVRVIQH